MPNFREVNILIVFCSRPTSAQFCGNGVLIRIGFLLTGYQEKRGFHRPELMA